MTQQLASLILLAVLALPVSAQWASVQTTRTITYGQPAPTLAFMSVPQPPALIYLVQPPPPPPQLVLVQAPAPPPQLVYLSQPAPVQASFFVQQPAAQTVFLSSSSSSSFVSASLFASVGAHKGFLQRFHEARAAALAAREARHHRRATLVYVGP